MADIYRYSSFAIELANEGELRWLKTVFGWCDDVINNIDEAAHMKAVEQLADYGITEDELDDSGFGWALQIDQPKAYIYGESEYVNIDVMASILVAFLLEHDRKDAIYFTYADTCSKPRPGHFGGGAVVCTKDGAEFMHTDLVVRKMVEDATDHLWV